MRLFSLQTAALVALIIVIYLGILHSPVSSPPAIHSAPLPASTKTSAHVPPDIPTAQATPNVQTLLRQARLVTDAWPADPVAEGRLSLEAKAIPEEALGQLSAVVLDTTAFIENRRTAIYLLSEAGPAAIGPLSAIAVATVDPENHAGNLTEVSLRITALEALDKIAATDEAAARAALPAFTLAFATHQNPALRTLSLAGLEGIDQGRPGKLNRVVERLLK